MFDFARALTVPSLIRYAGWRASGQKTPVHLQTRLGPIVELRAPADTAAANNDFGIAYEIFVHRYYAVKGRLDPRQVRLVVDLGTNIGFSVLFWLNQFPNSRVITFEAHPAHAAQAARNFALNGVADRVELHTAAAGAHHRSVSISNSGTSSTVSEAAGDDAIPMVDVFETLGDREIDLMKIDIEGGEYEIMEDPRFAALRLKAVVMEWHKRGAYDHRWTVERLKAIGLTVDEVFTEPDYGLLWAIRR
jgi:FkbM family methyltransferase